MKNAILTIFFLHYKVMTNQSPICNNTLLSIIILITCITRSKPLSIKIIFFSQGWITAVLKKNSRTVFDFFLFFLTICNLSFIVRFQTLKNQLGYIRVYIFFLLKPKKRQYHYLFFTIFSWATCTLSVSADFILRLQTLLNQAICKPFLPSVS